MRIKLTSGGCMSKSIATTIASAMGAVHLARPVDPRSRIPAAIVIKRMHPEMAAYDRMVQRFIHEATVAVRIDSPHVAKVYDAGRVGDTLYIAMEFIAGWSFQDIF